MDKHARMKRTLFLALLCSYFHSITVAATNDPPRAGGPLAGLTTNQLKFFNAGRDAFLEIASVKGTEPGSDEGGLGPRFNLNSCAGCHAFPAVGGTSPAINPQVALATQFGARNTVPFFISTIGPIREARFRFNPDGTPDGGVHALYVISGRADAAGCNISQPNFNAARNNNNISLRIPTPVFGLGLISAIPDSAIIANSQANGPAKQRMGIKGHTNKARFTLTGEPNFNANDGTIARFGWKAQNKSLLLFSGEAYNVEMGVTNELFQTERDETNGCVFNSIPEDETSFDEADPAQVSSDVVAFANFMRFLAPPTPKAPTPETQRGFQSFKRIGCDLCHTPTLTTGPDSVTALF